MQFDVVASRAGRQYGLITRKQVLDNCSRGQLDRWVDKKIFVPLHEGVYRINGTPITWRQDLLAAILARPSAVASHRAAALLWGFWDYSDDIKPEITIRRGKGERPKKVLTHTTIDTLDCRTIIAGIPCATQYRTMMDLARILPIKELGHTLDVALRTKVVDIARLAEFLDGINTYGRRGTATLKLLVSQRSGLDQELESSLESMVLGWIRRAGLPEPVAQHWIPTSLGNFRADFAYPEHKIAVEADGWKYHGTREAFVKDRERNNALATLGWKIFHVTARSDRKQFLHALDVVIHQR